ADGRARPPPPDTGGVRGSGPRGGGRAVEPDAGAGRRAPREADLPRVPRRFRSRVGLSGPTARRARAAKTACAANTGAGGLGGDRGAADRNLSAADAGRMAPDRADLGQGVPARPGSSVPVSRGRPGEVLRLDSMSVLRVVEPGLFTTVQDLGRPNAISAGVPPGGAMDRFAHRAANLLVGNAEGDAGLECTLNGPTLGAAPSGLVAITGAAFDPRVNGQPVPGWTGIFLGLGDRLTFGARRLGGRAYIALAGGVAGDRWLGSVSTYLLAARGGMHGRNLKAGDEISFARETGGPVVSGRHLPERLRPRYADHTLLAV